MDGTLEISALDADVSAGAFAMGGQNPKFDDIKIGIDNNAGDDLYMDEDFGSTNVTFVVRQRRESDFGRLVRVPLRRVAPARQGDYERRRSGGRRDPCGLIRRWVHKWDFTVAVRMAPRRA